MPLDNISPYGQQPSPQGGNEPSGMGGAKLHQLPKDVLEALENEDFEKALLLLKKHEEEEASSGAFSKFAPLRTLQGMFVFLFSFLKAEEKEALTPEKLNEAARAATSQRMGPITAPKGSLVSWPLNGLTTLYMNVTKTFQAMFNFFFTPALKAVIKPIAASSERIIEISLRVQQSVKEAFRQLERLGEPIQIALTRRIEPIQNWVKERAERAQERVKAVAEAAVQVATTAITPVVNIALVPVYFVQNRLLDTKKWGVEKALRIRPYLDEAASRFKQLYRAAIRTGIWGAKALYQLGKSWLLFLFELLGKLIQIIFDSLHRIVSSLLSALKRIWYGGGGQGELKPPPPRSRSSKQKK